MTKSCFRRVGYTQRVAHEREVSFECYQWSVLFPPCITKSEMIGMVVVAQLTLLTRRFVQVEIFGRLKTNFQTEVPPS